MQTLTLDEYATDHRLANATFCVVANSQAYAYFSAFRNNAAVNNFSAKVTTNIQTALSALAAQNCDMVMAHDADATPWLIDRSDFVFRSYSSGQLVLSAVFRRDAEDTDGGVEIEFKDSAVSNLLWASVVVLAAGIIAFVILCIGFRTYV